MTIEQINALEEWIEAIIIDKQSDHIQDTIYKNNCRREVLIEFDLQSRETEDD